MEMKNSKISFIFSKSIRNQDDLKATAKFHGQPRLKIKIID